MPAANALHAIGGLRLRGSERPPRSGAAVGIGLALCLHVAAFTALTVFKQANRVPDAPPAPTIDIVSLPPPPPAPPEVASSPVATAALPDLAPRTAPDPTASPAPETPATTPVAEIATATTALADLVPAPEVTQSVAPIALEAPEPVRERPVHRPTPAKPRPRRPVADAPEMPTPAPFVAAPAPVALAPASPAPAFPAPASPPASRTASTEAAFGARVREAVQDAVHYPASARMMGVTGRARLELAYRAGTLSGAALVQSSGTAMLDDAALLAAKAAHYPPSPPELGDRMLRFLIWVNFTTG